MEMKNISTLFDQLLYYLEPKYMLSIKRKEIFISKKESEMFS